MAGNGNGFVPVRGQYGLRYRLKPPAVRQPLLACQWPCINASLVWLVPGRDPLDMIDLTITARGEHSPLLTS